MKNKRKKRKKTPICITNRTLLLLLGCFLFIGCLDAKKNKAHYKDPYTCVSDCIQALYHGNTDKAKTTLYTSPQNNLFINQWATYYKALSIHKKEQFMLASFIFDNRATQIIKKDSLYMVGVSVQYKKSQPKNTMHFSVLKTINGYKIEHIQLSDNNFLTY